MFEKYIVCPVCRKEYPLKKPVYRCRCGGNLEIIFDYKKLKKIHFSERPFNHARYREFYPVERLVSLQEGGTPLVRSKNLESLLGMKFTLWFKNEFLNPTGSFKDRGSSVEIGKALEQGVNKVICASTGNMGASVAAYSGRAQLNCSVIVPQHTNKTKIFQIISYGARVIKIAGDYTRAASLAEKSLGKAFLLGDYLYRREGTKSIGFELAEQGDFDSIVCPIGNGNLISAVWKAFNEFKTVRRVKKLPKLIGVQAKGCSPVVTAFKEGGEIKPVKFPSTIASAIECGSPLDGYKALRALKESKGFCEEVTDKEIMKARSLLARNEGIFAEPAGAAPLAAVIKARERIERGSNVVCIVGGHGLKDPVWVKH